MWDQVKNGQEDEGGEGDAVEETERQEGAENAAGKE